MSSSGMVIPWLVTTTTSSRRCEWPIWKNGANFSANEMDAMQSFRDMAVNVCVMRVRGKWIKMETLAGENWFWRESDTGRKKCSQMPLCNFGLPGKGSLQHIVWALRCEVRFLARSRMWPSVWYFVQLLNFKAQVKGKSAQGEIIETVLLSLYFFIVENFGIDC